MYLNRAKTAFAHSRLAAPDEVLGCTEAEVAALEQRIGHYLPAAYREFLLWIGHSAGHLLQGSDVFYQQLEPLPTYAQELLQENDITTPLPEDAFVFYVHQGYQFMFFRLSEGDDPPVYYYGEGEGQDTFRVLYPSYSAFLETEIEGHTKLLAEISEMRERNQKLRQRRKSAKETKERKEF